MCNKYKRCTKQKMVHNQNSLEYNDITHTFTKIHLLTKEVLKSSHVLLSNTDQTLSTFAQATCVNHVFTWLHFQTRHQLIHTVNTAARSFQLPASDFEFQPNVFLEFEASVALLQLLPLLSHNLRALLPRANLQANSCPRYTY